jgi:putative membrane protein
MRIGIGILAVSLALSGAAIAQTGSTSDTGSSAGQTSQTGSSAGQSDTSADKGSQSSASQGPTDPQIAHIAATAHSIDIARGKDALKKSKNAEVKQFARQMVDDHSAGLKEAQALVKKLHVKPEDNPTSMALMKQAKQEKAKLAKLKGKAFDKEYIDHEVAYHKAVIDAVKNTLIPNAKNDQLKQLLTDAVPTLEGHLKHAENVQQQLGGAASASK